MVVTVVSCPFGLLSNGNGGDDDRYCTFVVVPLIPHRTCLMVVVVWVIHVVSFRTPVRTGGSGGDDDCCVFVIRTFRFLTEWVRIMVTTVTCDGPPVS